MLLLRVTGQAFEFRISNRITDPVDLLPSKRGTKRVRRSWRIRLLDEVIPCRLEQIAYSIYLWQLRSEVVITKISYRENTLNYKRLISSASGLNLIRRA